MAQQSDVTFGSIGVLAHSSPNVLVEEPSLNSVRSDPHWPHRASAALHSKRVLLAEDDDDLREVMSIFLTLTGYSVTACADAELASEAFRNDSLIDILMTDLEMPGRSGLELARELTALRPSLAVMIVSGALLTPSMSSEISDRNWTYLSKPYRLPMVFDTLHALHSEHPESRVA